MDRDDVMRRVSLVLAKEFELDLSLLVPTAKIYEDLGLDSLDAVDLIATLEVEFGVRINRQADEESIRGMRTLADVCSFVESKLTALT